MLSEVHFLLKQITFFLERGNVRLIMEYLYRKTIRTADNLLKTGCNLKNCALWAWFGLTYEGSQTSLKCFKGLAIQTYMPFEVFRNHKEFSKTVLDTMMDPSVSQLVGCEGPLGGTRVAVANFCFIPLHSLDFLQQIVLLGMR